MRIKQVVAALAVLSLTLTACGGSKGILSPAEKTIDVSIVYGSEKAEWLTPLIEQYNNEKHKTAEGDTIVITATAMGSIESINAILEQRIKPTVWSPASSIYLPVANAEWHKTNSTDLVTGEPKDLVLSPVVIAMWKPMAEALGWPNKALGWADIAALATSDQGWEAYGYPEWGEFKFGHTHPDFSNSGLVAVLAQVYAGAQKQRGLTVQDIEKPELKAFVAKVQSSIIHYGSSTGFFADNMFKRGPSYLSAAVLYENLVAAQESKRLSGQSQQLPVVAIYPKEGTFWANHPYVILNASWVTDEAKAAAQDFEQFLLAKPQQLKAIELGFRPSDPSIPLTSPLDAQHGVDPKQPQTVLEIPSADVIRAASQLWQQAKKPVDVVAVLDTSGSMSGDKITSARSSLADFVKLLDDNDRLSVITFSSRIITLTPLSRVGDKRDEVMRRISGVIEGGNTKLYDVTEQAYEMLKKDGDPKHIRAIVLLTDGQDTDSSATLDQVVSTVSNVGEEGGTAIKLFTIAFGNDADKSVLQQIAEPTGGKQYDSNPSTINSIYEEIATFF
jgi:Ca-activated chloride channel family protein